MQKRKFHRYIISLLLKFVVIILLMLQHSQEYLEAIEGAKGDPREKKLAAQIISNFFKHFPSLQSQAIEAIFDICEDDETTVNHLN